MTAIARRALAGSADHRSPWLAQVAEPACRLKFGNIVSGTGSVGPGCGNGNATVVRADIDPAAGEETVGIIAGEGGCAEAANQSTVGIAPPNAAEGVRANAIRPGLMNASLIHQRISGQYATGGEMGAARGAACPMGRAGTAWRVSRAALFLASCGARYVTGASPPVDGVHFGRTA